MNNEILKQSVRDQIKENGNKEITGPILQNTILAVINQFGTGSVYGGFAVPTTVPANTDVNLFYLAKTPGTYTNFASYVLTEGKTVVFTNKTGVWVAEEYISVKSIKTIAKTGTVGLVDTYTITYTDNTIFTFTVTNGVKTVDWSATSFVSGVQVFKDGQIYESNAATVAGDVPGVSSKWIVKTTAFSEENFDNAAKEYITSELISRDLSTVNMPNKITAGTGSSIYTLLLTENVKLSKIRVKVANNGLGNLVYKRAGVITPIASNVNLVAGWNDVPVSFDALVSDYIGYSTQTSTSELYFADGTGGTYYANTGQVFNGNIAVEVYKESKKVNTFEELVTADLTGSDSNNQALGTSVFYGLEGLSKPKLRDLDYGVVSYFLLPETKDALGNNKINYSASGVTGNFAIDSYNFSFGFVINFPNLYTSDKNVATINLGSYTVVINVSPTKIGATIGTQSNSITYDYSNKKVAFAVVGDARFLNVYANGQRIGFLNVGKKASKIEFTLNQQDSKPVDSVVYWDRDISAERAAKYSTDYNPFDITSHKDKLYPSIGNQLSNNFLVGNPYFDVPAEQTIVKFKGKYFLYFTAAKSTPTNFIESGVAVATSNRIDGGYMMYTNDVVIGGLRNKAGVTRAMASWAGVINDTVYVFAAMDYTASNAGGKIFKSTDGFNFTLVGDFIPTGIPYLANIGIFPEKQSNNYYYGVVEGKPGGGPTWALYLVRSLNIESGWQVVQTLPTLAVNATGMYGGGDIFKSSNGDRWMMIYHSAYELPGNAPTALFYAESTEVEPKTWVKKGKLLDINDELPFYNAFNCDQVATPQIIEDNGKTYISEVLAQNAPELHCQIRLLEFDGNKEELFGVVPLEYNKQPLNFSVQSKAQLVLADTGFAKIPVDFTKILALGSSITNGVGSDGASGIDITKAWRTLLQVTLTNVLGRAITVINGGVNGQNTTSMNTALPGLITANSPQIIIIEASINDAQTSGVGITVAQSVSNISNMINLAKNAGAVPILLTPMPIDRSVSAVGTAYTDQKRSDLAFAVRMLAKRKGVRLIDLDKLVNNDYTLLIDGLHPNPKGHLFMSNSISSEFV